MSLKKAYLKFLSTPSSAALSHSNPGFHYVTTTVSVNGASSIISHLKAAANHYEKKAEKIVSSFETGDSLVLEVETIIEFKNSGGNFLPGLEDNFLIDQSVTFPLIHVVNFQGNAIHQVRLYWDQSTLLKQLGVIGRSGRNWPIRDGLDQCKLVAASASGLSRPSTSSGDSEDAGRNRAMSTASMSSNSSLRPTRDPHSTLSLFAPREPESEISIKPAVIPPRSPVKPLSRDPTELFVGANEPAEVSSAVTPPQTSRGHKQTIDPKKYSHFEFGDDSEEGRLTQPQKTAPPSKFNSKNSSSWDFVDFVTPEKKPTKIRREDIRTFTWSDNEEETQPTPIKVKKVAAPRKDSAPHFDFQDTELPQSKGGPSENKPKNHPRRDAASQIVLADESPAKTQQQNEVPANKKAALNMINAHWDFDDNEHKRGSELLGGGNRTIYKTVGDGMGGRKNFSSHWDFEDGSEGKPNENSFKKNGQSKSATTSRLNRGGTQPTSGFWDF